MVYEETSYEGQKDEAYQVASCGAGEFPEAAGKGGEDGKAHCSQQEVGDEADGTKFHAQDVDGDIDGQIGEGDWHGAEGQGDREGTQYTC